MGKVSKLLLAAAVVALVLVCASSALFAAPVAISSKADVEPALVILNENPQPTDSAAPLTSPTLAESTVVWYAGRQWIVIGWDGIGVASTPGTATLFFSDANTVKPANTAFDATSPYSNEYTGSTLRTAMNSFYNGITDARERGHIVPRNLTGGSGLYSYSGLSIPVSSFSAAAGSANASTYASGYYVANTDVFDWYGYHTLRTRANSYIGGASYTGSYHPDYVAGASVTGDYIWPLSTAEASLLHPTIRSVASGFWWLRSPGIYSNRAASVIDIGSVYGDYIVITSGGGVRPAFLLNLESVIFSSSASEASGKSSAAVGGDLVDATASTDFVKFTIIDNELSLASATINADTVKAGDTVNISYTGATTGVNKYVSCVIADSNDSVLYYGKLIDCANPASANGVASLKIPKDIAGGDYTIKLFCEEANGDTETDFCSKPILASVTISRKAYFETALVIRGEKPQPTDSAAPLTSPTLAESTVVWYAGSQWIVIGLDGKGVASTPGTATLFFSDANTEKPANTAFDATSPYSNEYTGSTLRTAMNSFYNEIADARERGHIVPRNLTGGSGLYSYLSFVAMPVSSFSAAAGSMNAATYAVGAYVFDTDVFDWYGYHTLRTRANSFIGGARYTGSYHPDNVAGASVMGDYVWSLSSAEASLLHPTIRLFSGFWWLRSPGDSSISAATVDNNGVVYVYGFYSVSYASGGVRPVFLLNLESVIFSTSASAVSGKSSAAVGGDLIDATALTNFIKFTIIDNGLSLASATMSADTVWAGDTVNISYTGATTGAKKYVSCVIADGNDSVLYYGKLIDCTNPASANGVANLKIPQDIAGGNYTIKLFCEEANGDTETDFCSDPILISMTVSDEIKEPELVSIAVTTPPAKVSYFIGDTLDLTGLVVTGTYTDGSTKTETVTMSDISGFDSSAANPALTVTVTLDGKTAAFSVEIVELVKPNISIDDRVIIEVLSLPDKNDTEFNPKFSLAANEDIELTLYVAVYDTNGRLLAVNTNNVSLIDGSSAEIQASLPYANKDYKYKFFIWDAKFAPLTAITSIDDL